MKACKATVKAFAPALLTLLVANVVALTNAYASGGQDGGGGDTLYCSPDSSGKSPFVGYYSLDYLATYKDENNNADIVANLSWKDSIARIQKNLLRMKAYDFLGSFNRFVKNIDNDSDFLSGIIWEDAGFGLQFVDDQELINKLPSNCLSADSMGKNQFIQTVYWKNNNGLRIYNYDYKIIKKLEKNSPLQLSFLYVHEWLWNHFSRPEAIRLINRVIHSEKFDSMSSDEFQQLVSAFNPNYDAILQMGTYESEDGDRIDFELGERNVGARDGLRQNLFTFNLKSVQLQTCWHQHVCDFDSKGIQTCAHDPAYSDTFLEYGSKITDANVSMRIDSFTAFTLSLPGQPAKTFRLKRKP